MKSATSTHYLADSMPFLAYVIFPSNPPSHFRVLMLQKLLASKHYRLRDSKSRPRLGRAEVLVWSPTKLKKQETAMRLEPRFKTHGYSHCPTALLLFFFYLYANAGSVRET